MRDELPEPPGWAYEPKWDGFRAVAWAGSALEVASQEAQPGTSGQPRTAGPRLDSRKQRPLLRYFPELEQALTQLPEGAVVDGEVVVVIDGATHFDALQQRIHPAASRVNKLAAETPAELVAFDLLAIDGEDLRPRPFSERRERLIALAEHLADGWHLTPSTTDRDVAGRWFNEFESAGCDGIVAKRLDKAYVEGERAMIKVKHRRTVDVVIGGYRVHKDGDKVGSLLLGLRNADGQLHFIGHCSGFGDGDRVALLERLRPLEERESFGQGARQPGGPSRWTGDKDLTWVPVRPELVCEISYDQLTGERFRHATRFERWRSDKGPEDCTLDQLERPEGPEFSTIVQTA